MAEPAAEDSTLPLQAVEPRRLYRQIADQIARLIASGEFPPGARLPAERELASSLGVSRASVREAIISLEIAGLGRGARRYRDLRDDVGRAGRR